MSDRMQYLKFVQHPLDPITPSKFHAWKRDPVTLTLFKDLVSALFNELDNDLPDSFDKTIIIAHQRDVQGCAQRVDGRGDCRLLRFEQLAVSPDVGHPYALLPGSTKQRCQNGLRGQLCAARWVL